MSAAANERSQTSPTTRQATHLAELLIVHGVIDPSAQEQVRDFYAGGYQTTAELELAYAGGRHVLLRSEPPRLYVRASEANDFSRAEIEQLQEVSEQLADFWAALDDEHIDLGPRSRQSPLAG